MRRSISDFATDRGHFLPVVLVDLFRGRLDVRFGRLLLVGEEPVELLARLVEDREVVGESVEYPMDERVDVAVERVVRPHHRGPAPAGVGKRVDQQARRVILLREERAVEHRGLEHRDLQPRQQRLDAVGQVLGLEDVVEQHRDEFDRHRFELIHPLAERRLLQVAQHVVLAFRDAGELDERAVAQVEPRFAGLQPREALAQHRRRDDRRPRNIPGRRRRHRAGRNVTCRAVYGDRGKRLAAVRRRRAAHKLHSRPARARRRPCRATRHRATR